MRFPCQVAMKVTRNISSFVAIMSRKAEEDFKCLQTEVDNMISLKILNMRERHEQMENHIISSLIAHLDGRDASPNGKLDPEKTCIFAQPRICEQGNPASVIMRVPDNECSDFPCVLGFKPVSNDSHGTHAQASTATSHDLKHFFPRASCEIFQYTSDPTAKKPSIHPVDAQLGQAMSTYEFDDVRKRTFKQLPEIELSDLEQFAVATAPELPSCGWIELNNAAALKQGDCPPKRLQHEANHASGSRQAEEEPETNRYGNLVPKRPPADSKPARRPARCRSKKPPLLAGTASKTDGALPEMDLPTLSTSRKVQGYQTDRLSTRAHTSSREQDDQMHCDSFPVVSSPTRFELLQPGPTNNLTDSYDVGWQ